MRKHRFLLTLAVVLVAALGLNPALAPAKTRARPAPKEHAAKTAAVPAEEMFQRHVEQEIANLKEDVYTRATWQRLQEVKQQADDMASHVRMVAISAGVIGFFFGCVIVALVARRMGRPSDDLKIT